MTRSTGRALLVALASCAALGAIPGIVPRMASAGAQAPAASERRTWRLRALLDSGEVQVEVTSQAAAIEVVSPSGKFIIAFRTSEEAEAWARAAARLDSAPPVDGRTSDAVVLRAESDERRAYQLMRLHNPSGPTHAIAGTNGVWEFGMTMSAAQFAAVLGALRGDSTSGALAYEFPSAAGPGHPATPDVNGAWMMSQVDVPVRVSDGPGGLQYPPSVPRARAGGVVEMTFIVNEDGRVRPSSIFLIGIPNPVLAEVSRAALLRARLLPARIGRKNVPMYAGYRFEYEDP